MEIVIEFAIPYSSHGILNQKTTKTRLQIIKALIWRLTKNPTTFKQSFGNKLTGLSVSVNVNPIFLPPTDLFSNYRHFLFFSSSVLFSFTVVCTTHSSSPQASEAVTAPTSRCNNLLKCCIQLQPRPILWTSFFSCVKVHMCKCFMHQTSFTIHRSYKT